MKFKKSVRKDSCLQLQVTTKVVPTAKETKSLAVLLDVDFWLKVECKLPRNWLSSCRSLEGWGDLLQSADFSIRDPCCYFG